MTTHLLTLKSADRKWTVTFQLLFRYLFYILDQKKSAGILQEHLKTAIDGAIVMTVMQ